MSSDMSDSEDEDGEETEAPAPKLSEAEIAHRNALQAALMGKISGAKPKRVLEEEER